MSRRHASRNARGSGAINKGVGHKIKRPCVKKSGNKYTSIRPFGELPPSPKVKPADRIPSETTSPAGSESEANSARRFFRSRDLNRKATVVMSKELKYQLTSGGLVRSPAPTRRGPYKSLKAQRRPSSSADGADSEAQRQLLAAIEGLQARPATASPADSLRLQLVESDEEVPPLRRSPRKHGTATPAGSSPRHQQQTGPTAGSTPLRRSPRKQPAIRPTIGTPTHAENQGPTRLTLTPRRSPRKHPQTPRTPQAAVYDRLEEQLMKMEAGEDKENESPQRRKDHRPQYYSIFYRRPDGSSGSRSTAASVLASTPPASPALTNRAGRSADDRMEQLVIDAGQRQFGVITCSTCTLVYTVGDPEDEAMHARHHTGYLGALNFPGWKKECEVGSYLEGRVIMVTPKDAAHAWRKVDSVLRIVDAELGFADIGVRNKQQTKVFFFVVGRQIVGCLVAEPVSRGFPVLPRDEGSGGGRAAVRCSTKSRPCVVGVSRVWVRRDYRRKRIGVRMVEAMKNRFSVAPLRWQDVAFSDPTPDGLEFAASVTGSQEFLVYNQ